MWTLVGEVGSYFKNHRSEGCLSGKWENVLTGQFNVAEREIKTPA
jgi:hypothetical protein